MKFQVYKKIGMIILVALLLIVPLGMIAGVVYDRSSYRSEAINEIERTWTGAQRIAGPVLSIPYRAEITSRVTNKTTGLLETRTRIVERRAYWIPEKLNISSRAENQIRSRGIYSVPVYTSEHKIDGHFDISKLAALRQNTPGFQSFGQPELSLIVSDIRGISGKPTLKWDGVNHQFDAGSSIPEFSAGVHSEISLPIAKVLNAELPKNAMLVPVEIVLTLRGSQELSFAPLAGDVTTEVESTWPHPKFDGQFLPDQRDISADGFKARWHMSSFATDAERKLNSCANGDGCYDMNQLSFGVKFFEPVDIYVKVTRALRYGALFIVLTFVAFFLTETLTRSRLHPLQYALVGLSLALFYLLLVSLSEHIPFAMAYFVATLSCAGLIGIYLKSALGQGRLAAMFTVGIGLLYGMLYSILKSEDFALLMGSLLLFSMLAAVMLLTSKIDWYEMGTRAIPGSEKS